MNRPRHAAIGGALVASMIASAIACGDGSAASSTPDDGGFEGTAPPTQDATLEVTDAGYDADASDADATSPRTCSEHGFCHTVLPADQMLTAVWGDGTGIVWAVSEQGNVLRWDGQAWSTHASGKGALYTIWGSGPTDLWIGGRGGLFHGTGASSSAIAWTAVAIPGDPTVPILSLWGSSASDVWAVGGTEDIYFGEPHVSRVLHYQGAPIDGGPAWELDPISDAGFTFQKVWGANGDAWLGGTIGRPSNGDWHAEVFRRSPTGGELAWTQVERPPVPWASGTGAVNGGAVFADHTWWVLERTNEDRSCFWRGAIADGGAIAWTTTYLSDPAPSLRAIWKTNAGDIWLAGDDGFLRRWTGTALAQAAITVTNQPTANALRAMWGQGSDELWVVGDKIAIHRTKKPDGGTP